MQVDDFKNLSLPEKRRVLAMMQARANGNDAAADRPAVSAPAAVRQNHPRLVRDAAPADSPFALTDLQTAYLVAKVNPVRVDPAGCHVYLEFDVDGIDPQRLERAWAQVAKAHPMLRAQVLPNGMQRIVNDRALPAFSVADHRGDAAAGQRCIERVREELSHRLYLPGDWPLYEIRVTQLPEGAARIHVSMDSWIVDAHSAEQIYAQWQACYEQPDQAPAAPDVRFRDFIHSMKAFRTSDGHARSLAYWQRRLADMPDGPALPWSDAIDQAPVNPRNRRRDVATVPQAQWAKLQALFAQRKLSATAGVLAVFCDVLRTWTTNDRFGLVLTLQNRPPMHADIQRVVGPFTSSAMFAADRVDGETLGERARRYGEQLLEALDHGNVGAIEAWRSLGPDRPQRNDRVVFTSLLAAGGAAGEPAGWMQRTVFGSAQTPGTALHCQLRAVHGALEITFDAVPSWFKEGVVERMLEALQSTLQALADEPASWNRTSLARGRAAAPNAPATATSVPMTLLQQGYLAERIRQPRQASGYIFRSFRCEAFEPTRWQQALDALLADHPMLKAYASPRGTLECPDAVAAYAIPVADASDVDAQTRAMLQDFVADRGWPAFRLRLLRQADGSALLLSLLDMAAFDAHSAWSFYRELIGRAQGAAGTRESSGWKPFLLQRGAARGSEAHRRHWAARWADLPAGPRLAAPRVSSASATDLHTTTRWTHSWADIGPLDAWASAHGVSLEAVLLAAYARALPNDHQPFALGVVDYGLRQAGGSPLIGFGDATRFAWATAPADRSSVALLALATAFDRELAADRQHADAEPFHALRAHLASGQPAVVRSAVMTNCLDVPAPAFRGVTEVDAASDTPGVAIDNMVQRSAGGLAVSWIVRRDQVDLAEAQRCFDRYVQAIQSLVETPSLAEAAGERISADERAKRLAQLARWNATDAPYDRTVCLHTLFERRARAEPFAIAVLSDDEVLTYGELDARANRLANHLQDLGVGRGTLVAMMLPRTNHLVITALAIIKCGGAFIPLNIDDPQDRLARVLVQAQATIVVSTREHYGRFDDPARRVVLLDAEAEQIARLSGQFQPREAVSSEDRAYIIFTSGSTGTPKGVIVRHRPVVNLIEWAERSFHFNATDRVLFVNPLSFDLSIFDLFGMLAYGASIRIVSDADRTNALAVAGFLKDEPITFWNSAPAYLQMVLPFLEGGVNRARARLERMRVVFLSGDWIPLAMPDAMKAVAPSAQVISLGGATEAAVWSNYFPVESLDPAWRSIPYGRPIQNARYYILDEQREPVAVGEAGDLFIGGECLSDGYINEPELTAQSFVSDPFHERAGAIMYRTGDRARFFADGNIEFLGRIDHQVKLRGYRIELGEVEAALEAAGLPRAVAVVRDDEAGRRLVGFAAASAAVPPGELVDEACLASIRGRLPAYMVPAQVIVLPALPITPNGKVDRKRLTQERIATLAASAVVVDAPAPVVTAAPAGPIDTRLAEWLTRAVSEILGPDQAAVGLDDNLGQLGFSSLHYTMLGAKLANELGVAMNPALFFRYVSVAEIRDHLLREQAAALTAALLAAPAAVAAVATTAVHAQGDMPGALERWLHDAVNAVLGATETPVRLDDNLGQLGFNSLHYTSLAARLADELGMALNPALFFRYVSIAEIRDYLLREHASALASALLPAAAPVAPGPAAPAGEPAAMPESLAAPAGAVAIIGMSGVMPQAADLDAFWRNLLAGADNSSLIPADRWDWRTVDGDPQGPGNFTNVHRAAFMNDVAGFDAAFFSISPREAELMDPRQRLLLEGVWSCLEDAALRPGDLRGESVGLFVGATGDEYATLSLQPGREIDRFTLSGVSRTILANRVSYLFDWHGPSEVVDTACSSSLVAVHNAVRALQHGDCKLAIAGGINVMIDPVPHVCLNKIGMLAADGRCKTFDARADGYARGEGIGLILLKPLADALRDGDPIHAVIRGSAVNHGGRATALSAPNPAAQVQVIQAAIRAAGVDSGRIGYIEAHGTGTALGDPIEIEALKEVFTHLQGERGHTHAEPGSVALSSVKPNVGHLESAAGIAGLLKAILCVKHGQLPATLHLQQLNPNIHLDGSPFFIVRERQDWPMPRDGRGGHGPRLAGVSSFGFGGVNAHVVVEQHVAPASSPAARGGDAWWIPLSAQGVAELRTLCTRLSDYLRGHRHEVELADVAQTLQSGRTSLQERALLRVGSLDELIDALTALAEDRQTPALHWRGSVKAAPLRGVTRRAAGELLPGGDDVAERWRQHGDAAWPRGTASAAGRRIHLPTYPFAHTPYWLPALATEAASAPPGLLPASGADGIALAPTNTVLSAHAVAGRPVLPAAAYLALVRRAVGVTDQRVITLADAVWMQPFSATEPQVLRLTPGTSRQGLRRFTFASGAGDAPAEHCTVDVLAAGHSVIDGEPVQVSASLPHRAIHDACYAAFERGGVQLAHPYRSVQSLGFDQAGAVASLRIEAGDAESCWLLALDGALQAIALHHQLSRPDGAPSLPFHVKRVHLQGHVGGAGVTELTVRLAAQQAVAGGPTRVAKYDADLLDAAGRRIGRIESCAGKSLGTAAPPARAPKAVATESQAAHLYVPRWEPVNATRASSPVRGMLVSTGSSWATPAGWLRAERSGSERAAAARSLRIDAGAEADWSAVLADDAAPELIVLDYTTWPVAGGDAAHEAVYAPFNEAFALARAAMKLRTRRPLSVVAVYSDQAGSLLMPAVQALGAFGRAVRNESPALRFSALALAADPRRIDLAAIGATIAALPGDAQRAVNYRCTADGRLLAERLTKAAAESAPSAQALAAGSVVVVSGGAGGIGRLMASFLTARGCRVALLGRSDPAVVATELTTAGLADPQRCRYLQADVTQRDQVHHALDQVRRDWGPIQAVFHAAGGRADGMLLRKDSQTARAVLAAKVLGAIVLDEATRGDPLEHFIAFSSLASYLGPVGQADYAYANAFLNGWVTARNALVRQGQRRGASCSVGWPLWRDGGMRMSDAERDYIAQLHGMTDMATDTAMQCLLAVLGGAHETVALAVGDSEKIDRSMLGRAAGDLIDAT